MTLHWIIALSCSKPSPTSEKNIRCVWRVESQEISIWCCMMAICKSKRKIITNLKFTWHWSSHSTKDTEFSSIRSSVLPLVASLISCITTYLSLCSYLQWIFQFPKEQASFKSISQISKSSLSYVKQILMLFLIHISAIILLHSELLLLSIRIFLWLFCSTWSWTSHGDRYYWV